jgi:surface protein
MATRPDHPTNVIATTSHNTLTISWTPAVTGGPVSSFTAIGFALSRNISKSVSSNVSITSLVAVNGIPYIPIVFANGPPGSGSSIPPGSITPASIPAPPTSLRLVYTNTTGNLLISWRAPTINSGLPITGYKVYSNSSGTAIIASTTTTSTTVNGFTYGQSYRFNATAINSLGESSLSIASASFIPITLPASPTNVQASMISSGMNISWQTPTSTGGTPIRGYRILDTLGRSTILTNSTISSVILSSLSNGTTYNFGIMAVNAVGLSQVSLLTTSTLYYNKPIAPLNIEALPVTNNSTILSWVNPIVNYNISSFNITTIPSTVLTTTSNLSTVVSSLINGVSYKFSITATNLRGTSLPTTWSTGSTKYTLPNYPSTVTAVPGIQLANISWTSPISNGGLPIIMYNITAYDSSQNSVQTISKPANISSVTVSSLISGNSYVFGVTAATNLGYSLSTVTSSIIIQYPGPPDLPTNVSSISKNTAAILNWTKPSDNGLSITSYAFTTTPSGGSTIYYDSSGSYAVIGGLTNGTSYTISVSASNVAGAGPLASTVVTPTSNIVIPPYIPNPGLVSGPRIYARSGNYVSIFAGSNFQDFSYAIPLGTWSTLSNISTMSRLTSGATNSTISGNVSIVFPEINNNLLLKLNNGENSSGSTTVTYISSSAETLLSGAGGQFSTIASSNWDYARYIQFRSSEPMTMRVRLLGSNSLSLRYTIQNTNTLSVNWGDSLTDKWTSGQTPNHTYSTISSYTINVYGKATRFNGLSQPAAFSTLTNWGELDITNLSSVFANCSNLTTVPSSLPPTVTDLSYMFKNATIFNQNIGSWNTSAVTNMDSMFSGASTFNQNIGSWNTSAVTNMDSMFSGASTFNRSLTAWNASNVTSASNIFANDCPILSPIGTNYPQFSSGFIQTNPYSSSYYGLHPEYIYDPFTVAVSARAPYVLYTNNGINWVSGTGDPSISNYGETEQALYCVAWNGSLWLAGGLSLQYSTNGTSWTKLFWVSDFLGNSREATVVNIAWGDGKWVAIGSSAYDGPFVIWSYDGLNWYRTTSNLTLANNNGAYSTNSLAYAVNKFVYASNRYIMYSEDGITWTGAPIAGTAIDAVNATIFTVCWNGTFFLAGGSLPTGGPDYKTPLIKSEDGINWTSVYTNMVDTHIKDIVWNGTRFVAATAYGGAIYKYSSDGITWTDASGELFPTLNGYGCVTWNGTYFIGGAFENELNRIHYSLDGITWTPSSSGNNIGKITSALASKNVLPFTPDNLMPVSPPIIDASQNALTVAVGDDGYFNTTNIYYTDNGIIWNNSSGVPAGVTSLQCVASDGTRFIAGGSDLIYSTNGISWTKSQTPNPQIRGNPLNGLVRCIAWGGGRWVAVGYNGDPTRLPFIIYSDDNGVTWTESTSASNLLTTERVDINYIATSLAYGNGKFVFASKKYLIYSQNGILWEESASGITAINQGDIYTVCWNGSFFLGSGNGLTDANTTILIKSVDGITWTNVTTNNIFTGQIRNIMWNGIKFVATTYQGQAPYLYSTNGTTWNLGRGSLLSSYPHVTWNGTYFIGGGNDGAGGYPAKSRMSFSIDGEKWNPAPSGNNMRPISAIASKNALPFNA